jgi:hypothetical protein
MKEQLKELTGMPIGSPEWKAKLAVLKDAVLRHVQEEESELFQLARANIAADRLQELGRRFEQEKKTLAAAGQPDDEVGVTARQAEQRT